MTIPSEPVPGAAPATPPAPLGEPLAFRLLLDEAVTLTRRGFWSLYLPVAIPVALGYGVWMALYVRWLQTFVTGIDDPAQALAGIGAWGCASFLFFLLFLLAHGALAAAAVDRARGRPVEMGRRWRTVMAPRFFFTMVVAGLAIGGGLMLCVLPGIYLVLLLAFVVPVMVEEERYFFAAFRRAGELARYNPQGRWTTSPRLKIFVLLIVGYLISYVVSFIVQMPFLIVQQVMMFREVLAGDDPLALMAGDWQWLQVPAAFFGSLGQTAVILYMAVGLALLYADVRRRREGGDLETAIERLLARGGDAA